MSKAIVSTVRAQDVARRQSASDFIVEIAEKQPQKLVSTIRANPELCNGLKDFDYIVEKLVQAGDSIKQTLREVSESRLLNLRSRTTLLSKLSA